MSELAALAVRLDRLESIEAIRRLVATYAQGADRRNDPAIMRPLFADDAVWEAAGFSRFDGGDAIAEGISAIARDQITWSLHYMVSPHITLAEDGESARCHWYLWELCAMRDEAGVSRDTWLGGWYDSSLRRTAQGWCFSHVRLDLRLVSPNDLPWTGKVTLDD
ncbi:nuclear transport factor 2 family protein [Parapedomonas caeni]